MRILTTLSIFLSIFFSFSQTKELDSLSISLAFETADTLKVKTSLRLIENLYKIEHYDKALRYIIECEKLSSNIDYKLGIAKTAHYKALIYDQKNDYINAMDAYNKAKSVFIGLNDKLNIAKIDSNIGLLELKRGNSIGLEYLLSSIRELELHGSSKALLSTYTNLGKSFYEMDNINKAIEYNLKALEIEERFNDKNKINSTCLLLAELYSKTMEHRKAIEFYKKILNNIKGKNNALKGKILAKLGGEYLEFNDYKSAAKYLIEGLKLNRRIKDKSNLLVTLNNTGSLNLSQNKLKIAEKQLLEAGSLAKQLNNDNELLKHYKLMTVLDSTKKKYERAFVWQRKYFDLKEALNTSKNDSPPFIAEVLPVTKTSLNINLKNNTAPKNSLAPSNINSTTDAVKKNENKYKLLLFILLGLLLLSSTFLVSTYLKRTKNLKKIQVLEKNNLNIKQKNEAFAEQNKYLENINNVKDKLFSIVSHDLKDSLSSINGFIDLLQDGSLSREEFDDLIPELSENANNASLLLFNLLNWSKSQMQSLKPVPSLFDIQEVFEEKAKLIEQRTEGKGIELINRSLRDFAYADKSMFEIIIQNLLANAIKFSDKGDKITLSNHISNGSCIISISDTGVGISQDKIATLFEGNNTTIGTNNEKGTGLGLSICKELVELNNGKIWVESTLGIGSTFYVQLPKSKIIEA